VCVRTFWFYQNVTAQAARRKFLSAIETHGSGGPRLMRSKRCREWSRRPSCRSHCDRTVPGGFHCLFAFLSSPDVDRQPQMRREAKAMQ
jgi:hypothetical protein